MSEKLFWDISFATRFA